MKNQMKMIENKERISEISFEKRVNPFCPLGQVYYYAEVRVSFEPRNYYMDYCELDEEIQKTNGAELTIEQLAKEVYDMVSQFDVDNLYVTVDAASSKHFPVTVRKF